MKALAYLWCHRTKTFGFAQVTFGAIATTDGLFSPTALKLFILINGLLTAWLGFFNSSKNRTEE